MTESMQLAVGVPEKDRILAEYRRRAQEVEKGLYAAWQPDVALAVSERRRMAAKMLHEAKVFPSASSEVLEVGFGSLGWLTDTISWGVPEKCIHGVELDEGRTNKARELLPVADLRVGDATQMSWDENSFDLVIASTVFTSILDQRVRVLLAQEICRVLAPGGALLWYDFKVNNPRNPHVRKVAKRELLSLFPTLSGEVRSVTLAPPISRLVAPISWTLATVLSALPFLRTHLIAVLKKPK